MIKACIFDLDGTLLNTLSGITYYINRQFGLLGLEPIINAQTAQILGHGARNLITSALAMRGVSDGETVSRVFESYKSEYDADPTYLVAPYDGIFEMIDALLASDIRVAVLSNKPDFATRGIVKHFFGDKIMPARGAVDGVALKPAPDSLFSMMAEMNLTPEECVFIGDSESDVLLAKNASVRMVAVNWGFRTEQQLRDVGAETVVSSPSELLAVLTNT